MANLNHPAKQSFVAGEATLSMATQSKQLPYSTNICQTTLILHDVSLVKNHTHLETTKVSLNARSRTLERFPPIFICSKPQSILKILKFMDIRGAPSHLLLITRSFTVDLAITVSCPRGGLQKSSSLSQRGDGCCGSCPRGCGIDDTCVEPRRPNHCVLDERGFMGIQYIYIYTYAHPPQNPPVQQPFVQSFSEVEASSRMCHWLQCFMLELSFMFCAKCIETCLFLYSIFTVNMHEILVCGGSRGGDHIYIYCNI